MLLIQGDHHAWIDREGQIVQEVVVLATDEGLHVSASHQHRDQTSQAYVREKELIRVEWIQTKQALKHKQKLVNQQILTGEFDQNK